MCNHVAMMVKEGRKKRKERKKEKGRKTLMANNSERKMTDNDNEKKKNDNGRTQIAACLEHLAWRHLSSYVPTASAARATTARRAAAP